MPYMIKHEELNGRVLYLHEIASLKHSEEYCHEFLSSFRPNCGRYLYTRAEVDAIFDKYGWGESANPRIRVEIEFAGDDVPVLENQKREINICHS